MLVRAIFAIALLSNSLPPHASDAEAANLCRGDALRLCSREIPDRERITTCMERRKTELSPGCKTVFKAPKGSSVIEAASK